MKKILIVDDTPSNIDILVGFLGDSYELLISLDGYQALSILENDTPDLILLDIRMPGIDGFEVCKNLRQEFPELGIIMLTAKAEDYDKIMGLQYGTDDYLTKPFNPLELVARVKSQLRRFHKFSKKVDVLAEDNNNAIHIDDLVINLETHEVLLGDNLLKLTPTEFDILALLGQSRGKVFSIENIYESVWNQEFMTSDNTVMVHIRKIREKTEEDSRNPRFIKTVWGVGYKIEK